MKYKCTACGYIYDDNVETVKFEDLPADWVCPLCGLGKDFFEKIMVNLKKDRIVLGSVQSHKCKAFVFIEIKDAAK